MGEIENAEQELQEAVDLLAEGRGGASPEWVRAAERYVDLCRERVRMLNAAAAKARRLPIPESWEPMTTFFPRSGHRSN